MFEILLLNLGNAQMSPEHNKVTAVVGTYVPRTHSATLTFLRPEHLHGCVFHSSRQG